MPEILRIRWFLGTLCTIAGAALSGWLGLAAVPSLQAQDAAPAEAVESKGTVASPPATDEIDQLRARIERLERQIQQQEKTPADQQVVAGSVADASTAGTALDNGSTSPLLTAKWKNGLQISTTDDAFRLHVGGRLQFDSGWNAASDTVMFGSGGIGPLEDGAYFRRATLRIDGTMYKQISWLVEYDFANNVDNDDGPNVQPIGTPAFVEAWATISELPIVGNLRVGYMDEPLGFARLTSSRWSNFMERAPGVNSFTASSPGAMLFNWSTDERVTWAVGIFHPTDNNFGFAVGDGELAETARLTWLPWYADDGRSLLHVGIAASRRHPYQDQVEMRGRPSVRTEPGVLEPALADTGDLSVRSQEVLDVELAAVYGPWTIQSEYYATYLHDAVPLDTSSSATVEPGTLFYQGSYVELLYFLTGESRAYNRRDGVFDRVIPNQNFRIGSDGCGWGAWQVGVRYAYLDLQNKGINGATLHDFVVGLNWFLDANAKVQWNLAIDHRSSTPPGSDGFTYIFGTRLAIDF